MRLIFILLMIFGISHSLNITTSIYENEVIIAIDGERNVEKNLQIFIFKDNVQIRTITKTKITLPYVFSIPYKEDGNYRVKIVDEKGKYAETSFGIKEETIKERRKKEDAENFHIALGIFLIMLLVALLLLFLFLKTSKEGEG